MKAKLANIPVKGRGVEIESETDEEKQVIENIWNISHGGLAVLTKKDDEQVALIVAPTVEEGDLQRRR